MSIDKNSSGMPEFDLHRRTTKVNMSVVIAVLVFFTIAGAALLWFANR